MINWINCKTDRVIKKKKFIIYNSKLESFIYVKTLLCNIAF